MDALRLLLLPFSVVYGLLVWLRNGLYNRGLLKQTGFDIPVIVVGNLAVGGTGKSPMTEYLVRLLAKRYRVATLSRGYGRKTRGFREVQPTDTAAESGDEPLQFKRKFPEITVAVCEDRVAGVARLRLAGHQVVLLDDAFQHRALKPGLAILLFDYKRMRRPKWLLPAGNYRDWFAARRRADMLIVTKTPHTAATTEKTHIARKLKLDGTATPVLFAGIDYGMLTPMNRHTTPAFSLPAAGWSVLVVTGIANPSPLYDYLGPQVQEIVALRYPDHYPYSPATAAAIRNRFNAITNPRKLIITTEKDAQRLAEPALAGPLDGLPIHVVPIRVRFEASDECRIQQLVLDYCEDTLRTASI